MPEKLRNLEITHRLFWKTSNADQFNQSVRDQNSDYGRRELTKNEICTLALNEIAAEKKRGFFFHLPSRQSWTVKAEEERLPVGRSPLAPVSEYPSIVFMDYVWTDEAQSNFFTTSQRARYLQASAIINPPLEVAPLYGLQYIAYFRCPVQRTAKESLVLMATKSSLFLTTTTQLGRIVGHTAKAGELQINTVPNIWDETAMAGVGGEKAEQVRKLRQHEFRDLEQIYDAVLRQAHSTQGHDLTANLTGAMLRTLVPRPSLSTASAGSPLGSGISAEPPSRRKEKRKRQRID